ncbi:MAG: hypothetical protein R3E79_20180 [Caldilineaceae bacterium]
MTLDLPQATSGAAQPTGVAAELLPGLKVAFAADRAAAEPGQAVVVTLHWLLEQPFDATPDLRWQWRSGEATTPVASELLPLTATIPMGAWPVGQWLRQVVAIQPPGALPPGDYLLELVAQEENHSPARHPFTILPSSTAICSAAFGVATAVDFTQPAMWRSFVCWGW